MHRRQLLGGLLATASWTPMGRSIDTNSRDKPLRLVPGHDGVLPRADRNQGMGTTDAAGFGIQFPLRAQGAKQVWVDTVAGSWSCNGLSPYPGYRMNGAGAHYQVGASGRGASDKAFGPKATYKSGGSVADTESPNGISRHAYCQLVIGGADIAGHAKPCGGANQPHGLLS